MNTGSIVECKPVLFYYYFFVTLILKQSGESLCVHDHFADDPQNATAPVRTTSSDPQNASAPVMTTSSTSPLSDLMQDAMRESSSKTNTISIGKNCIIFSVKPSVVATANYSHHYIYTLRALYKI